MKINFILSKPRPPLKFNPSLHFLRAYVCFLHMIQIKIRQFKQKRKNKNVVSEIKMQKEKDKMKSLAWRKQRTGKELYNKIAKTN